MITDLYTLEDYYGRDKAFIRCDRALRKYGSDAIRAALRGRYVQTKILSCRMRMAEAGDTVLWLTDNGRAAARHMKDLYQDSLLQGLYLPENT